MTKSEFIDNINDIDQLKQFLNDNDLYELLEDVYSYDDMSQYIEDSIVDWAHNNNWEDLYDMLADVPRDTEEWYVQDDWAPCGWARYDDHHRFEDDKQDILDNIDEYYPEVWDDYRADNEELDAEINEPEELIEEIDFDNFFTSCKDESSRFIKQTEESDDEFPFIAFN